nr:MAG TPA: hypothetical protein [Caudoviricetes sp.]
MKFLIYLTFVSSYPPYGYINIQIIFLTTKFQTSILTILDHFFL